MAVERFYIIKDGERDGPFDESYVRFLLENDEIGFDDYCETGDGERFRLGTMYEPAGDEEEKPVRGADQTLPEKSDPALGRRRPSAVLYVGHPAFLKYLKSWLLVVGGGIGGYLLGPHSLWGMLACFAFASLAIIYIVVERSSHLYVVMPRRVEAIHGLVAKDSTEIRVEDIRTINVKRDGLAGLLGVGTVEFSSTGDAIDVSFGDVWGARRIKKLVRRLQDESEG